HPPPPPRPSGTRRDGRSRTHPRDTTMADALELDALWEAFHRAVNMTSAGLAAWLRVRDAEEETEPPPEQAGLDTGRIVLAGLQQLRTYLAEQDCRGRREVGETVGAQTDLENGPAAGDTRLRHRLMTLGHDPLKA